MSRSFMAVALLLAAACAAAAQDVLHYKFDAGGGTKVINFAARTGLAPAEASIVDRNGTPTDQAWTTGRFGSALQGDSSTGGRWWQVETGWDAGFTGSFTVAMFVRMRTEVHPSSGTVIMSASNGGESGKMAAYISGIDGKFGLGWTFFPSIATTTDVLKLAKTGWTHVAVVVDAQARSATFFVDGNAETPQGANEPTVQPSLAGLRVGTLDSNGSFDIDEFRFRLGTATATEIKRWARHNPAADGAYGAGCWPKGRPVLLDSNSDRHGPPIVGNSHYALELYGMPGSIYVFAAGTSRVRFGTTPLPLDLGFLDPNLKGCGWESSADLIWIMSTIPPDGRVEFPFPIPVEPGLIGLTAYSQAVIHSPALRRYVACNAFATAIGN